DLRAHVNVIALNPTPLSSDLPPSADRVAVFMDELRIEGVNATLRDTRGQEIDAACGQLRLHSEGTPIHIDRAALEAR
ncbi:MAG: hypothetical protein HKN93_11130, partial [Acidimicrobiia bacterium]|nr:hypothetical protein [Acidimicrobiia bacterium]